MRIGTVTPNDRWAWQQRAYRALGLVLQYGRPNDGRALPTIEWSIDDGLPCIRGDVREVRPVDDHWAPYEAFEAWRMALGLTKHWKRHNAHFGQTEYRAVAERWRPDVVGARLTGRPVRRHL